MEPAPAPAETRSRYVIGIDLGTTNSAAAFIDTSIEPFTVETFPIPQLVAPAQIEARETLPSFHYQPTVDELPPEAIRLPWHTAAPDFCVGAFARDHGARVPGRLISSAKSWLCHPGVDRTAPLLPWHGAPDAERLSPVDASARYLRQIHDAWNAAHPEAPMSAQEIVLTLPASFDEVARELTVKAAARAGLPRIVLIEEPQAAFYDWIHLHAADWESQVRPGQTILVCDIGGGTSDFTLIRVRPGEGGKVRFHRVAVGEHLILGGDNLDLALAHHVERRLMGDGKLSAHQWSVLVHSCRNAKETLLGADAPEQLTINIPGSGSRLIGGGLQVEVTRDEVCTLLVEGFFPCVRLDEKPAGRHSGFQEFGLPYAADAAITRYLAAFLSAHREVIAQDEVDAAGHDPARPDIVLFNGGVFASALLRDRLLDALKGWFRTAREPNWAPRVLQNDRLDLAVARGAAYFGMVRRGQGVRIAAGLARTYYIGVESQPPAAICLVPAGVESGQTIDLAEPAFKLLVSEPVEFPLYFSSTRLTDQPGALIPFDPEQMTELPPIRTVLQTGRQRASGAISVNLHARLTEIGTLELLCTDIVGRKSWRLQFDVRSTTQTDVAAHDPSGERQGFVDETVWQDCRSLLENTFGPGGTEKPESLVKRLTEVSGMHRAEWPTSLLRRFWETLMEVEQGRSRSPVHEARWLNLAGYSLRPGYGLAADDWRVAEMQRVLQGKMLHPATMCRIEWWILWRRIAGGLPAVRQQVMADPLLASLRQTHRQFTTGKGRGGDASATSHETAETWRLLGALELLPVRMKMELGSLFADLLERKKLEPVRPAIAWALGRVGARQPTYGALNTVVPIEVVSVWLRKVLDLDADDPTTRLTVMQMARRTGDRYRDIPDSLRNSAIAWLENQQVPHYVTLVRDGGLLDAEEQGLVFGEALPKGLRIL